MESGDITSQFLIVVCINIMLFLGQLAVIDTNPEAAIFYNCKGNLFADFESAGCNGTSYSLNSQEALNQLPDSEASISTEGNIFTDAYIGLKSFFGTIGAGMAFFINILAAPYQFLNALGLPAAFTFIIGSAWYAYTLIILILLLFGR